MRKKMVIKAILLLITCLCKASPDNQCTKLWSILLCTLEERKELFEKIYAKLYHQITENNLNDQVEILYFKDNREHSIGFKRNALLRESNGEYVCFVDDDDDVHDHYVSMIYEKLLQKPDCVSLVGVMTTQGYNPELFIHSIRYNNIYSKENGVYLRPPNHLNPIKRAIALQFQFPENYFGEDYDWTKQLARSGLLKTEAILEEPYYFYRYDGKYTCQTPQLPQERTKPRVSIIVSIYNGDEFIEGFLNDITQQTIFHECELILINANSPGHEEIIIKQYCERYPNIIYERLDTDPGLYAVWNHAIKNAQADLITNANIDDRRNPLSLQMQAQALEEDPTVDLVYSNVYLTLIPNETFQNNSHYAVMNPDEFSPQLMYKCLPGPQPMWRKALHTLYGFFDETFLSAGDLEFWNRLASNNVMFKKISGISGVFYQNPQGLSTNQDQDKVAQRDHENNRIVERYHHMWR